MTVRRIYVEKRQGFYDIPAQQLCNDLIESFRLTGLRAVRLFNRYDIEGLSDEEYAAVKAVVFSEPPVDVIYEENLPQFPKSRVFAAEYLPGQYDQTADSAAQCVQLVTQKERPVIATARVVVLVGDIDDQTLNKIKAYYINAIESREASLEKPASLDMAVETPDDVEIITGFTSLSESELQSFMQQRGFAMSFEDLKFCQSYFRDMEHRDPSITEIRVIDTYWSDHCRHTTFTTAIDMVDIEQGAYAPVMAKAYRLYQDDRNEIYGDADRDMSLMDLAVIGMKALRKQGKLDDLDQSEEINACSIVVNADINGKNEEWLVMFKNETHNHPTEIEPFGGAATCLGGAIRDPLSGRSYVYQAMRVTGAADPRRPISETMVGKLPQKKITLGAASGYSSYGNQIGLATGQVAEVYHEGFMAKRMEIGAVIAAAPKVNVVREVPQEGDVIVLVGGRTGRDGCGGATGSSKEHTTDSLKSCGAEVQKGNPPTERKIQRLFRNPVVSKMIKRCNDFGAGGVSVAIGELTDGLVIDLDQIKKKYEGLDGTELAISESQERMAVVLDSDDVDSFIKFADEENLEATVVAVVTDDRRLIMQWRGHTIVDLSRDFLDTNGVKQHIGVELAAPSKSECYFHHLPKKIEALGSDIEKSWLENLKDLNVCSQKGLAERFDASIGGNTVLMPFGGKNQMTPTEGMIAKLPVLDGETTTATAMTFGYNPYLMEWSPFHGAVYSVLESVAKMVALGGRADTIRMTFQEYFESLGRDPKKWGKPFSALLGALWAQHQLEIPAIGGKDSMSGTFMDLNVPPTLVSFAVDVMNADNAISPEFKYVGNKVYYIEAPKDEYDMPQFRYLKTAYQKVSKFIADKKVFSASSVRIGGVAAAITRMCLGNNIGFKFSKYISKDDLFRADYGALVIEVAEHADIEQALDGVRYRELGETTAVTSIVCGKAVITLQDAMKAYTSPLEKIFPTNVRNNDKTVNEFIFRNGNRINKSVSIAKPKVFIPVFPGTNCEYDSARAFQRAGGDPQTLVIRNLTPSAVEESVEAIVKGIKSSQIIMLPGGFSGGDEPDGSGKFIAAMFRNPRIKEAVHDLLHRRDGLMLGICNGFQALIKLGLVPYGEIRDLTDASPTLTRNQIGRHVSCMVRTKVVSNLSPWFNNVQVGSTFTIPVSHGEGRFVADKEVIAKLRINGQIATQYVNATGAPSAEVPFNPNGSINAIEGITSPDGRVLGKMGHSERIGDNVAVNVPGNQNQLIFEAGIKYYK
ncbi:MAG: phosphoribosylformylglycinamidine synthase [Anaerovibrio sp.]|uniref:phosphoribosylformylglycinamidine synthase n=1 Tax=Anaerovibrio sp. TaxID=1872532 RepID=UPI0025E6BD25|nr:phosphoribosylformylglycinamidine synthase [Anaerovibrio sp.]MCR5176433.1 phosphoribosylformylglycinamidine synthase [Anaerovibrio sp.]